MILHLRTRLLLTFLIITVATIGSLGSSAYYFSRRSADTLRRQILEENAVNVYGRLFHLLDVAGDRNRINRRMFETNVLPIDNFSMLSGLWLDAMQVNEELSWISLTLEESGHSIGVGRTHGEGRLFIQQISYNAELNRHELQDYWPADYPERPKNVAGPAVSPDLRTHPWYQRAVEAGEPIWTEAYLFMGEGGTYTVPGVSCASPVRDTAGKLVGVTTTDLDVYEMCRYLSKLKVGEHGFAFIVELRNDGTRPVIAHPDSKLLLRHVNAAKPMEGMELVPAEEIADGRVRAFMAQLPGWIERDNNAVFQPIECSFEGTRYLGGFQYVRGDKTPSWIVCLMLPEADVMQNVWQNTRFTLFFGSLILLCVCMGSMYVSRQVARPLEGLVPETEAVGRLEFEARPTVRSDVWEVNRLAHAIEDMKIGLRSFQKYVPSDLIRTLLESRREAALGGELREVTISFSDIADFTAASERLTPEELVAHLREYLELLSGGISEQGGTVDKYIGDSIMAFWGAPVVIPQHALAACTAAVRGRDALRAIQAEWEATGKPAFNTRWGLNTGEVVVGNFGSAARLNYTVIGDHVNLASRLEGLNKMYGTEILISESTFQQAGAGIIARPLDWVSVKGKTRGVRVYELLRLQGDPAESNEEWIAIYAEALEQYRRQSWSEARRRFDEVIRLRGADSPSVVMLHRCQQFEQSPPGENWDGIFRASVK